ncbi:NAD(P)-dependent oxidoreductase [Pseudomonas gingeri]|uniref:NAD-dependent epimerase/dehydratase family protein n=1 Tax=Pseudomonas gingeri TaxID=117681 RepID=UPI0015A2D181|nr:NAD(P)-dependent oxidoreductase [Pseudomonas gingeri]NWD71017.1 NAD(P)-dependent oxidoreductase [Pseudomonas gingeri]NWD76772.1 NAD(P)-dependent oxidoreductase [Pseudomonas gingeri]
MNTLKVLLTGACGRIGKTFFQATQQHYNFVLADRHQPDFAIGDHRFVRLDMADKEELVALVDGIDVVVHLAGIPFADSSIEELLPNNILATTYLLEAAANAQCKRVVFASSAQTIEGYPQGRQITAGMPVMPTNLFGVSKCYGEALCAFYSAQRGLSCIVLRIGAFKFPDDHDLYNTPDLSTWLSPRDAVQLLQRAIEVKDVQHLVAYGISNNRFKRLDLSETSRVLGYHPMDDASQEFGLPLH